MFTAALFMMAHTWRQLSRAFNSQNLFLYFVHPNECFLLREPGLRSMSVKENVGAACYLSTALPLETRHPSSVPYVVGPPGNIQTTSRSQQVKGERGESCGGGRKEIQQSPPSSPQRATPHHFAHSRIGGEAGA